MSGRSFISYSAQDAGLASAVYAFLKSNGYEAVKAPEDIALGEDWAASIASLIEYSDYFILLWTHNSMSSKEVAKELTLAMDCGSKIIPFRAEDLSPEGAWRYHLMNVQWLEAHAMPEAAALEALLAYFRRTQKDDKNDGSPNIKASFLEPSPANIHRSSEEEEISGQAKSLAMDYAEARPVSIDMSIDLKESRLVADNLNDVESKLSASSLLDAQNVAKEQHSAANCISLASWQFSAAIEIASTWGHSVDAASEVHSKRTFLGYRLCSKDGITIALIPLAMIDSKRFSVSNRVLDKNSPNESEPQKLERGIASGPLFSTILDIAKKMGYASLDAACKERSQKGLVNYVVRDRDGKVLARVPLSMINNRIQ